MMSSNSNKAFKYSSKDASNAKNKTNYGVSDRTSSQSSSQCASPTKTEVKKLPPIKAPVGLARGPDLKHVTSKIGSLDNVKHRPTGGAKKVGSQKLEWNAVSRIGSLANAKHKPLGGEVKVRTQKLEWKATSKIGSLDNVKHTPGGGSVKIFDEKYAKTPSAATTPTPSKSGSITPTIDARENCDTPKVTSAPNSTDDQQFQFTSRPSTANSIASSQKPSVDDKANNFKQSPINSQLSVEKSL